MNEKSRENRVRRMADRQGLSLRKSRRRDPRAVDYGNYWLIDPWNSNAVVVGGRWGLSLDDVEKWLLGKDDQRGPEERR